MIQIENSSVHGFKDAIRGMRNPMNSWEKSDSGICKGGDDGIGCKNCAYEGRCYHSYDHSFQFGKADYDLAMKLARAGSVHAKYRRMITVYTDITAPLYWWKEFDTYKVGTVANSCSTMHKIHAKEFTLDDFSHEHLLSEEPVPTTVLSPIQFLSGMINALNGCRDMYLRTKDKKWWWQMIQLLPSSYNQRRTIMVNYEVLSNVYQHRHDHKLDEWRELCKWIETLPYSEIITCNIIKEDNKNA